MLAGAVLAGAVLAGGQQLSSDDDRPARDSSPADLVTAGEVPPAVPALPRVAQLPPVFSLENDPPGAAYP